MYSDRHSKYHNHTMPKLRTSCNYFSFPLHFKTKNLSKPSYFQRLGYLDDEAEISMDAVGVSSDESSEEEEEDYDCSFVDDGMYLTQDNALE